MGQTASATTPVDKGEGEPDLPLSAKAAVEAAAPPAFPILEVIGVNTAERRKLVLTPKLGARLLPALPPSCVARDYSGVVKWYLLYNSSINGKSFQGLVQRITGKGPTVMLIKIKESPRVIGAFCGSDWLTVAEREKQAKSVAAALGRAAREGQKTPASELPQNQDSTFFGSESCFVFRAVSENGDTAFDNIEIYRPSSSLNSNFMYLFDTHPLADKIGIGMGGKAGYFGWFIDRWLENGASYGARCTTFSNPRLTATESWVPETVEVYAVKPNVVDQLIQKGNDTATGVSCINEKPDSKATQMLLELDGIHQFSCAARTEC